MKLPTKDIAIAAVVFVLAAGAIGTISNKYDDIQQRATEVEQSTTQNTTEKPTKQPTQESTDAELDASLMSYAKAKYMGACDEDGMMTEYCACTWDYLTARYTVGQISEMGLEYEQTNQISDAMWDAVYSCVNNGSY